MLENLFDNYLLNVELLVFSEVAEGKNSPLQNQSAIYAYSE